jgi:RHS repeat-associated protein
VVVTNGGITNDPILNGTTDFYYSGWQVVEEHDGSNSITQQYVYGAGLDEVWTLDDRRGGVTVAQLNAATGDNRHFYHADTLGSVYGLTNQSGALKEGYQYDAYGRQTVFTPGASGVVHFGAGDGITVGGRSALASPYLYTGQRLDAETGLDYFKNRYYDASLGRFVSRDYAARRKAGSDWPQPAPDYDPNTFEHLFAQRYGPAALNRLQFTSKYDELKSAFDVSYAAEMRAPAATHGYHDGMNLYAAYFVPNATDPTGNTVKGSLCRAACWAAGGAICAAVACGCAVGSTVTVGGLAIPCTAVIIASCAGAAGGSSICNDICPP